MANRWRFKEDRSSLIYSQMSRTRTGLLVFVQGCKSAMMPGTHLVALTLTYNIAGRLAWERLFGSMSATPEPSSIKFILRIRNRTAHK